MTFCYVSIFRDMGGAGAKADAKRCVAYWGGWPWRYWKTQCVNENCSWFFSDWFFFFDRFAEFFCRYRDGYPGEGDDPSQNDNLKFYTGRIASVPDGDFIDFIHEKWRGKYSKLEIHHGYIQWLFPIREHGMNSQSQKLYAHEVFFSSFSNHQKKENKQFLCFCGMAFPFIALNLCCIADNCIDARSSV